MQLKLCTLLSATTEFTNCSTPKTKVHRMWYYCFRPKPNVKVPICPHSAPKPKPKPKFGQPLLNSDKCPCSIRWDKVIQSSKLLLLLLLLSLMMTMKMKVVITCTLSIIDGSFNLVVCYVRLARLRQRLPSHHSVLR